MLSAQILTDAVDLSTGQVAFPILLAAGPGRNGLDLGLAASYSSLGLADAVADNMRGPTGVMGLGWSLGVDRIDAVYGQSALAADCTYLITAGGLQSRLFRTGTNADGSWSFAAEAYAFWQISYDPRAEAWRVVDETATISLFGGAGEGEGAVEWAVAWGGWKGAGASLAGHRRMAVGWALASVGNRFGDRISYRYAQDSVAVGGSGGLTFTQASYLAEIVGVDGARIVLTYAAKDPAEYRNPHADPAPPNAWQDRVETDYLAALDHYAAGGLLISHVAFTYAATALGAGPLTKRLLTAVARTDSAGAPREPECLFAYWGQSSGDGVSAGQVYNPANGGLYGAMKRATLPEGGVVDYAYQSISIGHGSRSMALVVPPGGAQPRFLFDEDLVLATWLDAANNVHLQAYVFEGRWLETDLATAPLASAADYAGVRIAAGEGVAAMFAGGTLFAVARDVTNPGAWLLPAAAYVPVLAAQEDAALAAGRGFAALLGLTGGTLHRYRFAAGAWTEDPAVALGTAGDAFALAAKGAMLAAIAAPAAGAAAVALFMRGTDGTWSRSAASLDLGGASAASQLVLGEGFGVALAAGPRAGRQQVRYGAFWWGDALSSTAAQSWAGQYIAAGATPVAPAIAGSTVAIGRQLYRFDGAGWSHFDAAASAYPGAGAFSSSAVGRDGFSQLFAGATAGQQVAALLSYDPQLDTWSTPAGLAITAAAPLAALAARGRSAGGAYALVGRQLWHAAPDGSWASVLTLPTALTAADLATAQLVGDDFLAVQQGTGGSGVATLVYLLENGGVRNASAPVTLAGSRIAVAGQPPSTLVGERQFVAYSGAWGSSASLSLYRPVRGDAQGAQTAYAAASVTAASGVAGAAGNAVAILTQYAFDAGSATVDRAGWLPRFNKATVIPGGAGTGGAHPNGDMIHGLYNGLSASETPAIPYPTGSGNASSAANVAAGLTYSRQARDSKGASPASAAIYWQVITNVLGQWGFGAYARAVRADETTDGVTSTSRTAYAAETGLPTRIDVDVYNAAGTVDTFTSLFTYGWSVYDAMRATNLLTPIVQTRTRSTPAGGTAADIANGIQTWRSDWGHGAGQWAPDRAFAALTASPPAFDAWQPGDPPPASGYRAIGRILARTAAGMELEAADSLARSSLLAYDKSGTYPVASGGNVAPGADMFSWFGCEAYEDSGAWASSDSSLSIWSYVTDAASHSGAQCLALPAATPASGPLLTLQPEDQTRLYLFSCWARPGVGFVPSAGAAQWTVQPYDPANGASVGAPMVLVLTPASPASAGWQYFQLTIDLPALVAASGKPALGLSIAATNANTASLCYVDELRFSPLDSIFSALVYDSERWLPVAGIDSNGQSTQIRYDASGRPAVGFGPNGRVDWIAARSWSRAVTADGAFSADFPNSALVLQTGAGSLYYDFRDGSAADWTFSGSGWSLAAGELSHSGASTGLGATAVLTASAFTYFGARIHVATPPPGAGALSISLGNGDVFMQWTQTNSGGSWQLVRLVGQSVQPLQSNSQVPWGNSWTFTAVDGFVLCFVDAVQVFAAQYQMPSPVPSGYGSVWLAATAGAAFDDLVVVDTPQIDIAFADGLGLPVQSLGLEGYVPAAGLFPNQMVARSEGVLRDALGRPAEQRLPMAVPVQLADLPGSVSAKLVEGGPAAYLYSPAGTALTLVQYEAGTGGYTYASTAYEDSPLGRPLRRLLPRPNDAGDPAANYTLAASYGGSRTVGGTPVAGVAKYNVATLSRVQSSTANGTQIVAETVTADSLGRVLAVQRGPSGGTALETAFGYDGAGRLATIRQPNAFAPPTGTNASAWTESRAYTYLGELSSRTTPDGGTIRYMYDSASRPRFVLDADGAAATPPRILYVKYDSLDRVVEQGYVQDSAHAWNDALQQLADVAAFPQIVLTPSGANQAAGAWRQRLSYDTDGAPGTLHLVGRPQRSTIQQGAGATAPDLETYAYDAAGNLVATKIVMPGVSPTAGWTTACAYDGQDRIARIDYPALDGAPPSVTYTYDRRGRLAAVGDQVGSGGVIDPSNPPTDPVMRYARYGYGIFGELGSVRYNNVDAVEQGAALERSFTYDPALRLTRIADPYFTEALSYGGGDLPVSYHDGRVAAASSSYTPSAAWAAPPAGFSQSFTYDGYGRLTGAVNSLGPSLSLAFAADGYDANGNMLAYRRGVTALAYSYAGTGAAATNRVAAVAQTVADAVDFTSLVPGTTSLPDWSWGASNHGPSASGLVASSPPGGQALAVAGGGLGHYEALRLATYLPPNATCTLTWRAATGTGYGQGIGAAGWYVLLFAESGPCAVVPLAAIAESSAFQAGTAAIDMAALIRNQGGGLPIVAAALELRNLGRNADGGAGPAIYLANVGLAGAAAGGAYGYDANGNVTAAPDRGLALTLDPNTGLTTSIAIAGPPASTLAFAYGADGRRSRATLTGGSPSAQIAQTLSLTGPDGSLLATRTTGGGTTKVRYYVNGAQGPFGILSAGSLDLLLTDRLGSTRVVVDAASGAAVEALDYLPFGETQRRSGPSVDSHRFTGQRLDAETGLYNFNARLYDPALGRFYATDPAGQYPSPYTYVGNDPVNTIDPTGAYSEDLYKIVADKWSKINYDGSIVIHLFTKRKDLLQEYYYDILPNVIWRRRYPKGNVTAAFGTDSKRLHDFAQKFNKKPVDMFDSRVQFWATLPGQAGALFQTPGYEHLFLQFLRVAMTKSSRIYVNLAGLWNEPQVEVPFSNPDAVIYFGTDASYKQLNITSVERVAQLLPDLSKTLREPRWFFDMFGGKINTSNPLYRMYQPGHTAWEIATIVSNSTLRDKTTFFNGTARYTYPQVRDLIRPVPLTLNNSGPLHDDL